MVLENMIKRDFFYRLNTGANWLGTVNDYNQCDFIT